MGNTNTLIPIVYIEELLKLGIEKYYYWDINNVPHTIVIGATGTGKTYLAKIILAKVAKYCPACSLFILDYKGDSDFALFSSYKHCFRYNECLDGLNEFYQRFTERQKGNDTSRNALVLFFDEYASFLNAADKKTAEQCKQLVSNLLMLGRSFNVHLIISQQRPDAQYFATARDNLNLVLALGVLSKESRSMFFYEYAEQMKPDRQRGTGYLLENGTNFQAFVVPTVSDFEIMHDYIKLALER